jgi:hypothetical protein
MPTKAIIPSPNKNLSMLTPYEVGVVTPKYISKGVSSQKEPVPRKRSSANQSGPGEEKGSPLQPGPPATLRAV